MIAPGKALQLLVGWKRQGIQIRNCPPGGVGHHFFSVAPDEAVYASRALARDQFEKREFSLSQDEIVDLRKPFRIPLLLETIDELHAGNDTGNGGQAARPKENPR